MPDDDPIDDIFDAIDRFVDDLFGTGRVGGDRPIISARGAKVEVHERDDSVEVVADLPGASVENVDLRCDGRVLRIATDDHDATVDLPVPVDETSADASFNNGVLSVAFERADGGGATLDFS